MAAAPDEAGSLAAGVAGATARAGELRAVLEQLLRAALGAGRGGGGAWLALLEHFAVLTGKLASLHAALPPALAHLTPAPRLLAPDADQVPLLLRTKLLPELEDQQLAALASLPPAWPADAHALCQEQQAAAARHDAAAEGAERALATLRRAPEHTLPRWRAEAPAAAPPVLSLFLAAMQQGHALRLDGLTPDEQARAAVARAALQQQQQQQLKPPAPSAAPPAASHKRPGAPLPAPAAARPKKELKPSAAAAAAAPAGPLPSASAGARPGPAQAQPLGMVPPPAASSAPTPRQLVPTRPGTSAAMPGTGAVPPAARPTTQQQQVQVQPPPPAGMRTGGAAVTYDPTGASRQQQQQQQQAARPGYGGPGASSATYAPAGLAGPSKQQPQQQGGAFRASELAQQQAQAGQGQGRPPAPLPTMYGAPAAPGPPKGTLNPQLLTLPAGQQPPYRPS